MRKCLTSCPSRGFHVARDAGDVQWPQQCPATSPGTAGPTLVQGHLQRLQLGTEWSDLQGDTAAAAQHAQRLQEELAAVQAQLTAQVKATKAANAFTLQAEV